MKALQRVAPHLPSRSPGVTCEEYRGWSFDGVPPPPKRSVHFEARQPWMLQGYDLQGTEIRLPMPAGEFSLAFPNRSVNLAVLVIDPDPGTGGGLE